MADLTTLAAVKGWLGITTSADDATLARLITAASGYIEQWTNRHFSSQQFTEVRDGTGSAVMVFADYPVTAVQSVVINGNAITPSPGYGQAGYSYDTSTIRLTGYLFDKGRGNVRLTYTAGYAVTPPEIEQACIELVALRYKERDRIGHQSKSLAGETVTFIVRDFPDSVRTILGNYKKVVPL